VNSEKQQTEKIYILLKPDQLDTLSPIHQVGSEC